MSETEKGLLLIKRSSGILFVLSGISGAGKTSVASLAIQKIEDLSRSVSYTSRKIRDNEIDGIDYHFVSKEKFLKMVDDNLFIEYQEVHGNFYGSSIFTIRETIDAGKDIILVIDVKGAQLIRSSALRSVLVFLGTDSLDTARKRLISRADMKAEEIEKRLKTGAKEIEQASRFDYIIINRDLEKAYDQFRSIVMAERMKLSNLDIDFES